MPEFISHAELDHAPGLTQAELLDQQSANAADERTRQAEIDRGYEEITRQREQTALADGALRAYERQERGLGHVEPTDAFEALQAEYKKDEVALQEAGSVKTLNGAFANEIEKVTDETTGEIDVDKLDRNDLIRYKAAIGPKVGESDEQYDARMQSVFGTPNYIGTVAKLMDEGEIWTLSRIEERNPGVNPLAGKLASHFAGQAETTQ